jgi:thiol-disulfide isomerase/thioredoxin
VRRWVAVSATAGLLAVAGCSDLGRTDNDFDPGINEGRIVTIDPDERDGAIEATGGTVDGDELDLDDYRGRVVVLNVWWSGCGPCRKEMPLLVDLVDDLGDDAALLGINIREASPENAQAFLRGIDVDFASFYDPASELLLEFDGRVSPYAVPSTAVLDRQGRLAVLVTGEVDAPSTFSGLVEDVLAEPAGDG